MGQPNTFLATGPCWLNIKAAAPNANLFSWCKAEFLVSGMKGIALSESLRNTPPPPMRVMSLNLKTVFNENKRHNEVIFAGSTVVNDVSIDNQTPGWEGQAASHVILRAPEHTALVGFFAPVTQRRPYAIAPPYNHRAIIKSRVIMRLRQGPRVAPGLARQSARG